MLKVNSGSYPIINLSHLTPNFVVYHLLPLLGKTNLRSQDNYLAMERVDDADGISFEITHTMLNSDDDAPDITLVKVTENQSAALLMYQLLACAYKTLSHRYSIEFIETLLVVNWESLTAMAEDVQVVNTLTEELLLEQLDNGAEIMAYTASSIYSYSTDSIEMEEEVIQPVRLELGTTGKSPLRQVYPMVRVGNLIAFNYSFQLDTLKYTTYEDGGVIPPYRTGLIIPNPKIDCMPSKGNAKLYDRTCANMPNRLFYHFTNKDGQKMIASPFAEDEVHMFK